MYLSLVKKLQLEQSFVKDLDLCRVNMIYAKG